MKVSSSKEKILKKIREALSNPVPLPFPKSEGHSPVFQRPAEELEIIFAEEFSKLQGKFAFCVNETDAKNQINKLVAQQKWEKIDYADQQLFNWLDSGDQQQNTPLLDQCEVAVTTCEYLVARTGSIVMSSAQKSGRQVSAYAPVHLCVAYTNQLVFDTKDTLKAFKKKYGSTLPSLVTFAAGPSRSSDIEKTWVIGIHGPKEVYLFLIDKPAQ